MVWKGVKQQPNFCEFSGRNFDDSKTSYKWWLGNFKSWPWKDWTRPKPTKERSRIWAVFKVDARRTQKNYRNFPLEDLTKFDKTGSRSKNVSKRTGKVRLYRKKLRSKRQEICFKSDQKKLTKLFQVENFSWKLLEFCGVFPSLILCWETWEFPSS